MIQKENQHMEYVVVDVHGILRALWEKAWAIILSSVLGSVIAFAITFFLITPQYQSSAMFYVNNSSFSMGDASFSISSGDITASKNLVDSYIVILKTRTSLTDVIDYAGVNRTYSEVRDMISASSVSDTEIFEVVVTSPSPQEAEQIASAIAYILPKRISSIVEGTSAKIVDTAVIPSEPSSPSYTQNTLIGFVLGFMCSVMVIIIRKNFDVTIRSEDDITQVCENPVLTSVPDLTSRSQANHYYGYRKRPVALQGDSKKPALYGSGISFAASESYKLLRTKLQFSFADEKTSRVFGVSSALSGEGKSLSSINLAYTLAQLDKRVLLIDCDLRKPTISDKLSIRKKPGLSSILTSPDNLSDVIQTCRFGDSDAVFQVITAGEIPPNPVELLSSNRMSKLLTVLRDVYDYIILDLPPVCEVSDAMVLARETDGLLLVVRQNYCNRITLHNAIRQFKSVNAKLLGIVFNCTMEQGKGYGKNYYKGYGKGYYKKSYSNTFHGKKS